MAFLLNDLGGQIGFGTNFLERNDDSSTQAIDITPVFENGLDLFGQVYNEIYINNNGSITFEEPRFAFTPDAITAVSNNPEFTPFFADVDTRLPTGVGDVGPGTVTPTPGGNSQGTNLVWYELDTNSDRIVVTWDDVGFFSSDISLLNAFQLVVTKVGDQDFNIEFRYEDINWTTGDASGGVDGLGGTVARAGYTAGDGENFFELPASGDQSQMLLLEQSQGNTGVAGLWQFDFRDGEVIDPNDQVTGGAGSDQIRAGEGNDTVFGLAGEDVLYGNQDDDVIYGNQDYDILFGGRGNDTLYGGQDGDILVGGVQNDVFYGNQGPDTMFGQGGADVFFIGPDIDLIPDFNPALDRVDVLDDIGLPEKYNLLRPTLDGDTFVFYKGGGVILQGLAFEDATIDIFL